MKKMTPATAAAKLVSKRFALQQFAKAVGLRIRIEPQDDGSRDLVLLDAQGEPLVREFDCNDMLESLEVYAGSHPDFRAAKEAYELGTR